MWCPSASGEREDGVLAGGHEARPQVEGCDVAAMIWSRTD